MIVASTPGMPYFARRSPRPFMRAADSSGVSVVGPPTTGVGSGDAWIGVGPGDVAAGTGAMASGAAGVTFDASDGPDTGAGPTDPTVGEALTAVAERGAAATPAGAAAAVPNRSVTMTTSAAVPAPTGITTDGRNPRAGCEGVSSCCAA